MNHIHLLITNYCNTKCNYCFEKDAFNGKQQMTMHDFHDFCGWCLSNGVSMVTVVGGEPTLHNNFIEILDILIENGMEVLVITNLLCDPEKAMAMAQKPVTVLINPTIYNKDFPEEVFRTNLSILSLFNNNLTLSYTLFDIKQDFNQILDYALSYGIKNIRFNVARPSIYGNNTFVSAKELPSYKTKIFEVIELCDRNGLNMVFDCCYPPDYFSREEIVTYKLLEKRINFGTRCNFLFVNTDLTISTCPHYNLLDKQITEYNNPEELMDDVNIQLNEKIPLRNTKYCVAEDFRSIS